METIKISGMSCGHCVKAVTEAIDHVPGTKDVQVSLEKGEASFETEGNVDLDQVKEAVRQAGYQVE